MFMSCHQTTERSQNEKIAIKSFKSVAKFKSME
jgi:hypothetical protein